MKNPRRIALTKTDLLSAEFNTDPPPPDSIFWNLWNSCASIAKQALATPYIQGIGSGSLDPNVFGGFYVNDAYYCFNGEQDYCEASKAATDPNVKTFLQQKYLSYSRYNEVFPTIWHVSSAQCAIPNQVTADYSAFETSVAASAVAGKFDPVYLLIAMLPCEYLWAWLAQQLAAKRFPNNVYQAWIDDNADPSGAFAMGNFLASYQGLNQYMAHDFYSKAMQFELDNFLVAPLPLIPILPPPPVPPTSKSLAKLASSG